MKASIVSFEISHRCIENPFLNTRWTLIVRACIGHALVTGRRRAQLLQKQRLVGCTLLKIFETFTSLHLPKFSRVK